MNDDNEMREKLEQAGKKAVAKQRKEKVIPGAHLLGTMRDALNDLRLTTVEKGGYFQTTGKAHGRKLYLALQGGRAATSGYDFEHDGLVRISEEEAKARHLGRLRGEIDFSKDDRTVLDAYSKAVEMLLEDVPAPAKAAKAPALNPDGTEKPKRQRKPKAPKTDEKKEEAPQTIPSDAPASTPEAPSGTEAPLQEDPKAQG